MDYDRWIESSLKSESLTVNRHKVSVHYTDSHKKPLMILVHGITGDFYGLVPLAAELSKTHQIAVIELPGHGESEAIENMTAAMLRHWFVDTIVEFEKHFKRPDSIVAHSFGCLSVLDERILASYRVVLLNPVPTPSETYRRYATSIMRSARFWAYVYNWPILILLRSMALAKLHQREAKRRIRWVGWRSRPSFTQVIYQAGLVNVILDSNNFSHTKDSLTLVVCGLYDTTAVQRDSVDFEDILGKKTPIVFLRGGHLLPIEDPTRVATVIRSSLD